MTAPTEIEEPEDAKAPVDEPAAEDAYAKQQRRSATVRLLVQPAVALLATAGILIWAFVFNDLTVTQRETLNSSSIVNRVVQHIELTVVIVAIVVAVAVPLGIILTRPGFDRLSPLFVGIANVGQAAPAIGLLVLFYLWVVTTGIPSFLIGVLPIAFYSLLPVLRNTILGFQEVDPALIDAGRGQGMSSRGVLWRVEFPLAVPFMLAGLRTTLVLAVGTATLSFLVGAGGLGVLIDTGYKLRSNPTLYVGAVLAVALALMVDWLGALAERYLGPKGLR